MTAAFDIGRYRQREWMIGTRDAGGIAVRPLRGMPGGDFERA